MPKNMNDPQQIELYKLESENLNINNQLKHINEEINAANMTMEETSEKNTEMKAIQSERLLELQKRKEDLLRLKEETTDKITEINEKISQLNNDVSNSVARPPLHGGRMGRVKRLGKTVIKDVASIPVSVAANSLKGAAKSAVSKANPFDKPLNKNDVTDSGTESIKLAYTSVKKGKNAIKTVNRSVKTSVRTIKTTGNVVKASGRAIYQTTRFAVKAAATTAKVTISAATHITAFLMNPFVIVILAFLIIFTILAGGIVTIIAGDSTTKEATAGAAGLVEVDEQYNNGVSYFNTAYNGTQNNFNSLIDSLYFSYDDLTNSDLVKMSRFKSDSLQSSYGKGFASDAYKSTLKAAWNLSLDVSEVLAVTYVYLEKEQNAAHDTSLEIYKVSYTQEILYRIISEYVHFSDTVSAGQKCPNGSCTQHVNPEYQTALDNLNLSAAAYNDWGDIIQYIAEYYSIPDGASQSQYWDLNPQQSKVLKNSRHI